MTAPLILRDPSGSPDEHDVVMMLNDFTARDPAAILADLEGRGQGAPRPGTGRAGMKTMPAPAMPGMAMAGPDLNDVSYDALLANRRPLSDPDVIRALPGRPVRLRIINAASGTNFFIRTGALRAEAIAVDGADIVPLPGRVFELAVAQRIDLRVRIPRGPGAYPILAQGEGTDMLAAWSSRRPTPPSRASAPRRRARRARSAMRRRRGSSRFGPSRPRAVDRTIRVALTGDMARYVWTLNGRAWPDIVPLAVRKGERVEITFANETGMAHPMHLHGHVFQVTEIDGMPAAGRDAGHRPRPAPSNDQGRARRGVSRLLDDPLPSALSPGGGHG